MRKCRTFFRAAVAALAIQAMSRPAHAAPQVRLLLPLNRGAYQTNELVDLAVVRSDTQALPASDLSMAVTGSDGSKMTFTFSAAAVPLAGNDARTTEHLRLNGRLLRPGHYTVAVAVNGATAAADLDVLSHLRRTPFKLIDWMSRASPEELPLLGENSLGFNLIYGTYRPPATARNAEETLRGGADYMQCCTMGGGHQMDLRQECDWSDPNVIRGGTARVVQQAFASRTTPNCLGVHFYDEPGLTWCKDPETGEATPHSVPAQVRANAAAFGEKPPRYNEVKPGDREKVARWEQWARWKLSFLDAAWKDGAFGVSLVRPDYLSANQSEYAWYAYADGYYFNVVRSLPVLSGHGGYDDGPGSYLFPSFYLEMGRMRDLNKPVWYLPSWFAQTSEVCRLEQYLSFMQGVQGMAKPPDHTVHKPSSIANSDGIVEANMLMARLGTIFTTMPVTRPPVAMLYSLSQAIGAQVRDMKDNYEAGRHSRAKLLQVYIAGKMIHTPFFPVVEEDVLDGTLAAHHKAVVLAGINTIDPRVVAALETYIASGGTVILTDDCQVQIKGSTRLGVEADAKQYELMTRLWEEQKPEESLKARAAGLFMRDSEPLAKALQAKLEAIGIRPVIECNNPSIVVSRQAEGDVEYLFAVNATWDEEDGSRLAIKPTSATFSFKADGRPIYDAVRGGGVPELAKGAKGKSVSAAFRFGPGQMRVFARTARPIGGVRVHAPALFSDYTVADSPVRVTVGATVVDKGGGVVCGSVPLQVCLRDPHGAARYDLYRATDHGVLKLALPLAANDPRGLWRLEVTELLAGTKGTATFGYAPPAQCGAVAGDLQRAVWFADDRNNIYRFFRMHQDVTLVTGASDYNAAAAERLAKSLAPWDVRCTTVTAAQAATPRELTEEEAKTWVGLSYAGSGAIKPGRANDPVYSGFAVKGPVLLLGTPEDNPLIQFIVRQGFLPYTPGPDFPGRGRGMVAWQRDAVGHGQDSIALIAYDATGMAEAVGSMYEMMAGIEPLTPLGLPADNSVSPALATARAPEARTVWRAVLPDRALNLTAEPDGKLIVVTLDGTLTTLDGAGKVLGQKQASRKDLTPREETVTVPETLKERVLKNRIVKHVVGENGMTAVAYWGGTLQVFDAATSDLRVQQMLPQDVARMAWKGGKLIAALADGSVVALDPK